MCVSQTLANLLITAHNKKSHLDLFY